MWNTMFRWMVFTKEEHFMNTVFRLMIWIYVVSAVKSGKVNVFFDIISGCDFSLFHPNGLMHVMSKAECMILLKLGKQTERETNGWGQRGKLANW